VKAFEQVPKDENGVKPLANLPQALAELTDLSWGTKVVGPHRSKTVEEASAASGEMEDADTLGSHIVGKGFLRASWLHRRRR